MKRISYILLAGVAGVISTPSLRAQQQVKDSVVNRTVVVEQEYNPYISDASKVNVLPGVEPPAASKKNVEYDAALHPAGSIPAGTMAAYTAKEVSAKAFPGYLRLGYGNYGNLDVLADYRFTLSTRDRLNLAFGMDGMNGKLSMPGDDEKWKSHYYRTHARMDYTHAFRTVDLDVAGDFGLSNFNYLPDASGVKQKFTSGGVHLGVRSTDDGLPLRFRAETNLLLYGRQYGWVRNHAEETLVLTKAEAVGALSEGHSVGVGVAMRNVLYNHDEWDNYTALDLNPHYLFENENWKIRLGAQVNLSLGYGKSFYASPDVQLHYTFSDSYRLYLSATGGKQLNDFRHLEEVAPYGVVIRQLDATYEQLNAALGFRASPFPGVWFHLYGGYQELKNDLLQSFYSRRSTLLLETAHTRNAYAGADIRYSYKEMLTFHLSGVYRNWSLGDEAVSEELLLFKPALEADFRVDFRPIRALNAHVGYRHITREKVDGLQADPVGNLYLGADYELFKHLSLYAKIGNLLNKEYQYYAGYPAEGIHFVGGLSLRF